jgi:tetratricopeptide (TPR) repeat protein
VLPPLLALTLVMFGFEAWRKWRPLAFAPFHSSIYHQSAGAWQRLPELPAPPESIQVSDSGALWALMWPRGKGSHLARLENGVWHVYGPEDFGVEPVYIEGGFALEGEHLWAPTRHRILEFDGKQWKIHHHQTEATPSSVVAAAGQVWLLDPKGQLAHFDGTGWTSQRLSLPGVQWYQGDDESAMPSPTLAPTSDGALWLIYQGVWRQHGTSWEAVGPKPQASALFLGAAGGRLWFWDSHTLALASLDGKFTSYPRGQTGLARLETVYQASTAGARTVFATRLGILEFDGTSFRHLVGPQDGVNRIASVAAGAGGDLFALGTSPNPKWKSALVTMVAFPLGALLGTVAILIWGVRRWNRYRLAEHRRSRQALEHATGAAPADFARDEQRFTRQASWWGASASIGTIFGALIGYSLLRHYWRAAPSWMYLAIALALHAANTLRNSLVRRTPQPSDPIEPGPARFDWSQTRKAIPGSLVVFLLLNLHAAERYISHPAAWILGALGAWTLYEAAHSKFVISRINRGDYDAGLRAASAFQFQGAESADTLRQRGQVLVVAGRFEEAEEALLRALAKLRAGQEQALVLDLLGEAQLEQGHTTEAMRSWEAALHAASGFVRPYRGMADLVLRQGGDPRRALEYLENIPAAFKRSLHSRITNGNPMDDYWSLKAWALAQMGRGGEAQPAIAEAMRATNRKSKPDLAATFYRAGMALETMGNYAAAGDYFRQAVEADPQGRWGRRAKAGLAERSAFRV